MSVQWVAVQIVGDTLRLPIASEADLDKPLGCTSIGRNVERIVVNPFSDSAKSFEPERGTCHDVWDTELTGRLRFQCSECGGMSLETTPRFCPVCGRKVVDK